MIINGEHINDVSFLVKIELKHLTLRKCPSLDFMFVNNKYLEKLDVEQSKVLHQN